MNERSMISIRVSNGIPYVWDPQDWLRLRRDHRILGCFDGAECSATTNLQLSRPPFKLSTVETQYLISQGICKTVHVPSLCDEHPAISPQTHAKFMDSRAQKHFEEFKTRRKTDLEMHVDDILEGKRKKGKLDEIDRETFISNELNRITKIPYELVQLDIQDPWVKEEDCVPYDFPMPKTYVEKLKFRVFEDFHLNKNYYISLGHKFGGDFLAYAGDPVNHHSEFIMVCPDRGKDFIDIESQVVTNNRLASTVKKTLVIAIIDEKTDKLMYYVPDQLRRDQY